MAFVVAGIIIVIDIATGLLKGWKEKDIDSSKLRDGLFKKAGELIVLGLAYFLEYFATIYIDIGIDIPMVTGCTVYIVVMELISILENVCLINPNLSKFLSQYLNKLKGDNEE